jgi:probable HAF family extracellular repeat protein
VFARSFACAVVFALAACGGGAPPPQPKEGASPIVDPYKELIAVDSSVVLDARASNATDGPWSFRWTVEQLAPPRTSAARLVEDWLRSFHLVEVNGRQVDDRPAVDSLLASWPRTGDGSLDLARAPFRLLAIAARLDLDSSPHGEGRLIFGLVDPASGGPGLMTAAFEYRLPSLGSANDRQAWAARWHSLRDHGYGNDYNAALQVLTDAFARAGVDPAGVNGSALAQLRTNEAAFGSPWEQREWTLARDGNAARLAPTWTSKNPDQSLDGSPALAQFIVDHASQIRAGYLELPRELLAGTALETGAWRFPGDARIDEPLRHAFAIQTCNGCHAAETFSSQGFFHVNPLRPIVPGSDGRDRLSEFLRRSELRRRADHLAALLAGTATGPIGAPTDLPAPLEDAPHYDVVQVPAPEDGAPVALDSGRVLGNSTAGGPWIYDGSLHFLFSGDTRSAVAQGFNSRGDVVGYFARGGIRRAFVFSGGVVTELGTLGGGDSAARLVNDSGFVAGDSTVAAGDHHAFVYRGALRDIGSLGGADTSPFAIGPTGLVTGESQLLSTVFRAHAFVWDPGSGTMADLGTLGGNYSRGQAIDAIGHVAGFSTLVPSDEKVHAFIWDGATMTDLGSLPGLPWSGITGRNKAGAMVGMIYDVPTPTATIFEIHAFVYLNGAMLDLNTLAVGSPAVLRTALGIDDAGRILCTDGQVGAPRAHGLLLTPR